MSARITGLSLSDVRCFSGEQSVRLAKITLLVGENSAGKTTFLGCLNALGQLAGLHDLEDGVNWFDKKPFFMGPFRNIARQGATSFHISAEFAGDAVNKLAIRFGEGDGPAPHETALELHRSGIPPGAAPTLAIVRETPKSRFGPWWFDGPEFRFRLDPSGISYMQFTTWLSQAARRGALPFSGNWVEFQRVRAGRTSDEEIAAFIKFKNFFSDFRFPKKKQLQIVSVDPRELKPQRVYEKNPMEIPNRYLDALGTFGRQLDPGLFMTAA